MSIDFIVVIPTLNEERSIELTLQHVLKQKTRCKFEIVVVDGGSTDGTREIAQKYVKVLNGPKKGKAYQLNYAVSQTDSKFVVFLDADTIIPDNYIERINVAFKKDPELWVCGASLIYTGFQSGVWHTFVVLQAMLDFAQFAFYASIWFLLNLLPQSNYKMKQVNYFYNLCMFIYYSLRQVFGYTELTGSNICVRRDIFNEIGGFRQPPKLGVDMLFCQLVRTHIQKRKRGKIKIFHTLHVETDVRHLETVRSLKRLAQHRELSEKNKKKG